MAKDTPIVVRKSLISWITTNNKWLQLLLVITAILAVFANVVPLEMQKRIVNQAIENSKLDLLIIYCLIYLAAVIVATVLKYMISVLQTIIGQRTVYEMRDNVYRHALTLPLSFYRRTQPGLVVSALTKELATAGDFVGEAVSVPVTNVLMLVVLAAYLFWLNPLLAIFSFAIYPIMLIIVPILQKRVNQYNINRIDATRKMSGKVGETVSGIHEIHANSSYSNEGDIFQELIKNLWRIRIKWNLFKQGVKRVNSLFVNFSRFVVFALGGYLAIEGRIELGALVAFLSAQDKLYVPWKELIQFYQSYQTAQVTYDRTMTYFDSTPDHALVPEQREPYKLTGDIEVENLEYITDDGVKLLSDVNLKLKHGEHMALVGYSGSGKSTLVKCIGQLYPYTAGKIQIDQKDISQLSKADMARNIGFVSQNPFIFEGSIQENLLYAFVSRNHGQSDNQANLPRLDDQILILQQVGLFTDVLRFGLETVLEKEKHQKIIDQIIQVQKTFQQKYRDDLTDIIEFYDPDQYLYCSSVAENLMFGESPDATFQADNLHKNDKFIDIVKESNLLQPLLDWGVQLTEATLNYYDNRSFEQEPLGAIDLIAPDYIDEYKKYLYKTKKKNDHRINRRIGQKILRIALNFIPNKHRYISLPDKLIRQIVESRPKIKEKMHAISPDAIKSCCLSDFLYTQSILTNILFGKVKNDSSDSREKLKPIIHQLLIEYELLEAVVEMGLQHYVGSKGDNLSGGQQQKVAIGRALLKNPPILILDEATSGLDNDSQDRIQRLLGEKWRGKSTLIAVVHRTDIIKHYDKIAVMKDGKIVECGTYNELMAQSGALAELVQKEQD